MCILIRYQGIIRRKLCVCMYMCILDFIYVCMYLYIIYMACRKSFKELVPVIRCTGRLVNLKLKQELTLQS